MAGNAKRNSERQKQHYKQYESFNKWAINKKRKIERHLKSCPNDKCASNALERGFVYSRKQPKAKVWSHSDKATATLFGEFGRSGHEVIEMKKAKKARDRKDQLQTND